MHRRPSYLLVLATLLAGALAAPAHAQTAFTLPDTLTLGSVERAILRFEQSRSALIAGHDTASLRRMYADEFRGVTALGFPVDRSRLLTVFTHDDPTSVFAIDEIEVHVLGQGRDAALLTARLTTRRRTGELVAQSRFIHVYTWREGRWQILAAQGTALQRG